MRKYYEAYDDRYRQVHSHGLRWFAENASPIVLETLEKFAVPADGHILEIGCGEGRDACPLLGRGYRLLATDLSSAAVEFCKKNNPEFADHFACLDCLKDRLEETFDFIYAVAVVHMLVADEDRDRFYQFLRSHLNDWGIGLICCQGDGQTEQASDVSAAFDLQERIHEQSGQMLHIAGTSYRSVSFDVFSEEIYRNGLEILEMGLTDILPDYWKTMYAVVKRR